MPVTLPTPESTTLTEPTSIQLLQAIQLHAIATSLSPNPILTSCVHNGISSSDPMLLLHGFDSSVLEFRRLLPPLAAQRSVWALDLLGFGFTERLDGIVYSSTAIRQHLYACWQARINQPVILVGASMGGAAALDFALAYPDAVKTLILIDSAGYTVGPNLGHWLIPPLGFWATEFLRNPNVRRRISEQAYCDRRWASADALCCASLHLNQPRWREALISFTQSGGYRSFKQQLPDLVCPTLIIWGDRDRILGTTDAAAFHQGIPHSKLLWVNDCGHVPHLEQPDQTAQAILDFCQA
jgi:pimeloyl-ACP methyl ester carboxylesterase